MLVDVCLSLVPSLSLRLVSSLFNKVSVHPPPYFNHLHNSLHQLN